MKFLDQFTLGNILSTSALLISFWLAHKGNVKRIENGAARMARLEEKMDLIYEWFKHNVVGRGESARRRKHPEIG